MGISYDFGELVYTDNKGNKYEFDFAKVKWRLRRTQYKPERWFSGIDTVDEVFGGFPLGLTVFCGEAGTGKSLLAKTLAKTSVKALYVLAESEVDNPNVENVVPAIYYKALPNYQKAIIEIFGIAREIEAEIIVIDSITKFLSGTYKAVEEAEIRGGLFEIARRCEKRIPVIGISEVRGSGQFIYPAGGQAVAHASSLYIWFNRYPIKNEWIAERFNKPQGNILWTLEVIKDKEGQAIQNQEFVIDYDKDLKKPTLISIEQIRKKREDKMKRNSKVKKK